MRFAFRQNAPSPYGPPNQTSMNGSFSGPEGPNSMKPSFLSPAQSYQLRAQIMAYRLLSRNQPVPASVGMAAQGKRTDLPNVASQPEHGGQNVQRLPGNPVAGSIGPTPTPIRPQGYPTQQPITSSVQQSPSSAMGPPQSTGSPLIGSTASPLSAIIPSSAPRPPQAQVKSHFYYFIRKKSIYPYVNLLGSTTSTTIFTRSNSPYCYPDGIFSSTTDSCTTCRFSSECFFATCSPYPTASIATHSTSYTTATTFMREAE